MYKVNLAEMEIGVEEGRSVISLIKEYDPTKEEKVIACKVNNEIKTLNYEIQDDSNIEYIYTESSEGIRIYRKALSLILIKAVEDLYPNVKVIINYAVNEALYCEFKGIDIIDEFVVSVRNRMKEIIEENMPIIKKVMPRNAVRKMYKEDGHLEKLSLLNSSLDTHLAIYYLDTTYGYFYGKLPISTGYMKVFELKKFGDGILLMYPDKENVNHIKPSHTYTKLYGALRDNEKFYKQFHIRNIADVNDAIKSGKINEIIRISEAMHEKKIAQIADMIKSDENKRIVLIAGPSSSGKTTFAQRLGVQLKVNNLNPITISVDNYFVEREDNPVDENGEYDFECLEAVDLELFNDHLTKLLNGEEIEMPEFNFTTGHKEYKGNKVKMNEGDVLVIEGIHCLNDKLTEKIPLENKFKIFICALTILNIDRYNRVSTTDTRLIRRIIRDNRFRSYPIDKTIAKWKSVRRGEDKYIYPYQESADVIFNSAFPYEFAIFRTFLEPLLLSITQDSKYYSDVKRLYEMVSLFLPLETKDIPINSILREFTGEGCFYR
ncbi:MAG: nucleoside kinase [Clostridiales bacterium]|nr:nucleoside kinase [Clostridiales bacterium]